jgi:hypothetical protein
MKSWIGVGCFLALATAGAFIWPEAYLIALLVAAIVAVVAGSLILIGSIRTGCFILDYIVIQQIVELTFKLVGLLVLAIIQAAGGGAGSSKQ